MRARIELGKKRLVNILTRHGIATMRTLEQKIADAGPGPQRVDPLYLTVARHELAAEGRLHSHHEAGTPWYYLRDTPRAVMQQRLAAQLPTHRAIHMPDMLRRIGQALEIAVFKALREQDQLAFLGGFTDLDAHDDQTLYQREDPPQLVSGTSAPGRLDFLLVAKEVGFLGVEVKNTRPWIYPDSPDVRELLLKCCTIDAIPVLIARRISYVAFTELFEPCGILVHQVFNQRYPSSAAALATAARDKNILGYHDVRPTNEPDARLRKFLHENLPAVLPKAAARFRAHKDLLLAYGRGELRYAAFHRELRRRRSLPH